MFVESRVQINCFAFAAVRPQLFAHASAVIGNQSIGRFEDAGRGAIVLLQTNGLGIREVCGVLVDIFNLGATPALN